MTEEQIALARRAVACKGWRWMLGCRVAHIEYGDIETDGRGTYLGTGMQPGDMFIQWDDHAPRGLSSSWSSPQNFRPEPHVFDYCVPDLTEPATLGCLLALVREATTAYASLTFEPGYLHTEVENLVAALEAAP
jgi:hypothetical protein